MRARVSLLKKYKHVYYYDKRIPVASRFRRGVNGKPRRKLIQIMTIVLTWFEIGKKKKQFL